MIFIPLAFLLLLHCILLGQNRFCNRKLPRQPVTIPAGYVILEYCAPSRPGRGFRLFFQEAFGGGWPPIINPPLPPPITTTFPPRRLLRCRRVGGRHCRWADSVRWSQLGRIIAVGSRKRYARTADVKRHVVLIGSKIQRRFLMTTNKIELGTIMADWLINWLIEWVSVFQVNTRTLR